MTKGLSNKTCLLSTVFLLALWVIAFSGASAMAQTAQPLLAPANVDELLDPMFDDQQLDETATGTIIRENELLGYCMNVSDLAMETRSAILTKSLTDMEAEVDQKLSDLEGKMATLEDWLKRREVFLENANRSLVEIYRTMRPDAAAEQMSKLDPIVSAAIVTKLDPQTAGAILQEMKPDTAAGITMLLSSAVETEDGGS